MYILNLTILLSINLILLPIYPNPREEPITAIFLNQYTFLLHSKHLSLYPQRSGTLIPHLNIILQQMETMKEIHNWSRR